MNKSIQTATIDTCILLSTASLDLAHSLYRLKSPSQEICDKTGIELKKLKILIKALRWDTVDPPYNEQIIASNLNADNLRTFKYLIESTQLIETQDLCEENVNKAFEKLKTNPPKIINQNLEKLICVKGLETQIHIVRMVENGTPQAAAFSILGFNKDDVATWLKENKFFRSAIAMAKERWSETRRKKISLSDEWKASAWELERHPHSKEEYSGKEEPATVGLAITMNFKRKEEKLERVFDNEI